MTDKKQDAKTPTRRFRKKPVVIEAVQYPCVHPAVERFLDTPEGIQSWSDMMVKAWGKHATEFAGIRTLEGIMRVSDGDWIITGVQGEHYPCKPDIFAATYEDASAPKPEAQAAGMTRQTARAWLQELLGDHDFIVPVAAFDELVEALSTPASHDALLRYGRHEHDCVTRHDSALKDRPECTCGFAAALAAVSPESAQQPAGDRVRPFGWYRPRGDQEPEFRTSPPPDGHGWLPVPGFITYEELDAALSEAAGALAGEGDAVKAAYVKHFGSDDGWLSERGSYFIEGYAVALAQQPAVVGDGHLATLRKIRDDAAGLVEDYPVPCASRDEEIESVAALDAAIAALTPAATPGDGSAQ